MHKISIEALARKQLKEAVIAPSARAADTVFGGHEKILRQTVVGIRQGAELGERDNHDESTIYVLQGRVRLRTGDETWIGRSGDLLIVPRSRHSLEAIEDSAVLITIAKLKQ
ncbi:cupin domain-containing protein [Corynebacterium sputi]|uniref:cupin domain-containing protein n=1 Tax=Corynebacterium sputi TaxID=489915 RepID=UPI00047B630D|nr:cupin domain-containing protein [Corynebacterium sputi]